MRHRLADARNHLAQLIRVLVLDVGGVNAFVRPVVQDDKGRVFVAQRFRSIASRFEVPQHHLHLTRR